VSPGRAVRMSLVHDLAESLVGDITPTEFSGVSKADKSRLESAAMRRIVDALTAAHRTPIVSASGATAASSSAVDIGTEVFHLWEEYESGATATARYVKLIDKIEMYLQAHEYEQSALQTSTAESLQVQQQLQRFFDGMPATREKAVAARQPLLVALIDQIQSTRTV